MSSCSRSWSWRYSVPSMQLGRCWGAAVPLSPCDWDLGCPGVVTAWVGADGVVLLEPHPSLQGCSFPAGLILPHRVGDPMQ